MFLNIPNQSISNQQVLIKPSFKWGYAALFGGLMLAVWLLEVLFETSFSKYGLRPRNSLGLWRVIVFPFLHGDWKHLLSNLLPFSILSVLVSNMFPRHNWKIFLLTFALSGFWTWCFARPGTVVGASGWVYALLGFLLWTGFSKTSHKAMAVAGGLAFLYGGFAVGLVPIDPRISWEGHLMGLMAGFTAAVYWRHELGQPEETEAQPTPIVEKEPPYPYWLYDRPHVMDQWGSIIPPEKLEWVDGKPRSKEVEPETPVMPSEPTSASPVSHTFQTPVKVLYVVVKESKK